MDDFITIKGAKIHNLKNIDVRIPKNKLTVITGVSGSGKSSLAFDTLYEEGKRRYLLFSGTQFMVDTASSFQSITGLSPTVAVEQRIIRQSNPRSTVGTRTKISNMLAIFFSTFGKRNEAFDDGIPLSMEMFQKNSPKGMCVKCLGKGQIYKIDEEKLFGNRSKAIDELVFELAKRGTTRKMMDSFCKYYGVSINQKTSTLSEEQFNALKYGDGGKTAFPGFMQWIMQVINSPSSRLKYLLTEDGSLTYVSCPKCGGTGLGQQAIHTTVGGKTIADLENMHIKDLLNYLKLQKDISLGSNLLNDIIIKLECMVDVGLHHLSLSRPVPTLSGGEIQRLFLASFIIAEMDSIIFIFDEPTIGLHEVEKEKLISIIKNLVCRGNTVVAVEHDENFMKAADYIIDIGPNAGIYGGQRVFQGTLDEFMTCNNSKTAPYLAGSKKFTVKTEYKPINVDKILTLENASLHNLHNITVDFPLGLIIGVAGVSGSGKSSLIADTLVPKLKELLKTKFIGEQEDDEDKAYENYSDVAIKGIENIGKCVVVDQKAIGRSRTSCPATYVGIFDRIRKLLANTDEAKENGYKEGLFSVNSQGGCRVCKGDGVVHYHVGYGNFIDLECESCGGTGFVEEAMEVKLKGKNIREILAMSVLEAVDFFRDIDKPIYNMLSILSQVGLGYLKLGQQTPTISGGEAQRIKLAKELGKRQSKNSVYILDEPTTGLSFDDTEKLINLLQKLGNNGNTIIITEHDPIVLSNCDYIIELGPGGGSDGGYIIATGTPEELKENNKSIIGRYLQ
ncbi:excinuclease ABC subunit UvrA [Inconstantimicrobium mannanitabidum]|uniref:Excinuclease ABC subunit A n=1 Tax=Inconstantimicrobium mannanitabidum TaxID=1604901 RepID=A0ACB5RBH0_9CLOT|nr:excinuclease ABC subunit UvrA [Clostridium sp. TW13]GKX66563.1 excinuclease ABC subunit A [Clostridium sp. TW13]